MFFIVLLLTSLFVEIALFRSIQRLYLVFSTTVRIIMYEATSGVVQSI